jgi:serine/threonine protein phosphatase PrpC
MNFKNASASIIGNSHHKRYSNNQDSYNFYQDDSLIIGVIADGCGAGLNSEVGARLVTDFVIHFCKKNFRYKAFDIDLLKTAVLEYLRNIVKIQNTNEELEFIENYLFFTLFGFIIQPPDTFIFHSGDGMYILNDYEVIVEQNNRPNYIAKSIVSGNFDLKTKHIKTNKLNRILIATDGLTQLTDTFLKGQKIEGMQKIADFFDNENHFDDIFSLPKLITNLSITKSILKDDTTIIMIKKS